jgi:hypothetical protein
MKIMIAISPSRVSQILIVVVFCLTLTGIAAGVSREIRVHNYWIAEAVDSFVRLFDLAGEANIAAWYASSTLLICAALLATIAIAKRMNDDDGYVFHWTVLSLIFLYLSVDEAAILHEMAIKPLRSLLNTSGLFYYAWIIPGFIAVLVFVLAYVRFLTHLPKKTRLLFIAAGALYVAGAIGFEAVSGLFVDSDGTRNITWELIATIEELFEMLGIVLFIYTLLDYISSNLAPVAFTAKEKELK